MADAPLSATQVKVNGRVVDLQNMSTTDGVALYNSFPTGSSERQQADAVASFIEKYNGTLNVDLPQGVTLQSAIDTMEKGGTGLNKAASAAIGQLMGYSASALPGGKTMTVGGNVIGGGLSGIEDAVALPFNLVNAATTTAGEGWRKLLSGHAYSKEQTHAIGAAYAVALIKQETVQKNLPQDASVWNHPMAGAKAGMDYLFVNNPLGIWGFLTTLFRYVAGLWHEFVDHAPAPQWSSISQQVEKERAETTQARGTEFHQLFANRVAGESQESALETFKSAGRIADIDTAPIAALLQNGGQMYGVDGHIYDVASSGAVPTLTAVVDTQTGKPITPGQRVRSALAGIFPNFDTSRKDNVITYGLPYVAGGAAVGAAYYKGVRYAAPSVLGAGDKLLQGIANTATKATFGVGAGVLQGLSEKLGNPAPFVWWLTRGGDRAAVARAEETVAALQREQPALQAKLAAGQARVAELEKGSGIWNSVKLNRARAAVAKYENRIESAATDLNRTEALVVRQATLESQVAEAEAKLAQVQEKGVAGEIKAAQRALDGARDQLKAVRDNLGAVEKAAAEKAVAREALLKRGAELKNTVVEAEKKAGAATDKTAKKAAQGELKAAQRELAGIEKNIEKMDNAPSLWVRLTGKGEDATQALARTQAKLVERTAHVGGFRGARIALADKIEGVAKWFEKTGDVTLQRIAAASGRSDAEVAQVALRATKLGRFGLFGGKIFGKALPLVGGVIAGYEIFESSPAQAETINGAKLSYYQQLDRDHDLGRISEADFLKYRALQTGQVGYNMFGIAGMAVGEVVHTGVENLDRQKMMRYVPESMLATAKDLVTGSDSTADGLAAANIDQHNRTQTAQAAAKKAAGGHKLAVTNTTVGIGGFVPGEKPAGAPQGAISHEAYL